jgi:spore coat protein H
LDLAVNDLRQYLSKDRLAGLIKEYREVTDHFVYRDPDKIYNPLNQKEYDEVASKLPLLVDRNYEFYKESLKKPLPFFIGTPETNKNDGTLKVMWDASYDFQEENLTYTAILSKNPDGSDVLGQYTGEWTQASMPLPEPGQYFLKVYATNESGFSQDAFDIYAIDSRKKYYGTICFYINNDGSVSLYTTED